MTAFGQKQSFFQAAEQITLVILIEEGETESVMAFELEWTPKEDIDKYHLVEIDKLSHRASPPRDCWCVDRERDIYLRFIRRGREEIINRYTFHLHWKGALLQVVVEAIAGSKAGDEDRWIKWDFYTLGPVQWDPRAVEDEFARRNEVGKVLKAHRTEIIQDLKEALSAFNFIGMFATQKIETRYTDNFGALRMNSE